ncbi:unnamed protein product [Vicia faba]|uniref:Uncharacterized protein n=1 Tax=Vicia faba TaxID=3906 RepID=A0AAV0ZIB1_VICFA|nr:unnamed protein product [Vicia faba]
MMWRTNGGTYLDLRMLGPGEDRCERIVRHNWNGNYLQGYNKIKVVSGIGESFKEFRCESICEYLNCIEELPKVEERWDTSKESIKKLKSLYSQRNNLMKMEEAIWRQRSRALWLQDGDKNTIFFHGKVEQRKRTNHISKLKEDNGKWWMGELIIMPDIIDVEKSTFVKGRVITNNDLIAIYSIWFTEEGGRGSKHSWNSSFQEGSSISHIFFPDDSILFSCANSTEVERIMEILSTYQKALGQIVNLDKSEASFS